VTFERLIAADALAMVAALALLLAMSADWYSSHQGDEARRIDRSTVSKGGPGGQISRALEERARVVAEGQEKNAWHVKEPIDRVILGALLATVVLALGAGFLRAAGRRFPSPWTPSALAAAIAVLAACLVGYRMLDQPGVGEATTVKSGAPIALLLLGLLVLFCSWASRAEEAGTAWREVPAEPEERPT